MPRFPIPSIIDLPLQLFSPDCCLISVHLWSSSLFINSISDFAARFTIIVQVFKLEKLLKNERISPISFCENLKAEKNTNKSHLFFQIKLKLLEIRIERKNFNNESFSKHYFHARTGCKLKSGKTQLTFE